MGFFCNIAGSFTDIAGTIVARTAETNGNFSNVAANESGGFDPNAATINL
jgi:hypothetical protein